MFEKPDASGRDEDGDRDLEEELVYVVEAPQIVDYPQKKNEESARYQDRKKNLIEKVVRQEKQKRRDEREDDRPYDGGSADMRDLAAGPAVGLLAYLPSHRHADCEGRKEKSQNKSCEKRDYRSGSGQLTPPFHLSLEKDRLLTCACQEVKAAPYATPDEA
jgi:hypothetical protein